MAKTKTRANGTYIIDGQTGDNPKLMGQVTNDGRTSLYLEYYNGFEWAISKSGKEYKKALRETERLGIFIYTQPTTPEQRQYNKQAIEFGRRLRFERGQQVMEQDEGYRVNRSNAGVKDVLAWMWNYYEEYTKKDKRHIKRAIECFEDFLTDPRGFHLVSAHCTKAERMAYNAEREKRVCGLQVRPKSVDKAMIMKFVDYIQWRYVGQGPHTLYSRFKKIILAATEAEVFRKNPCSRISVPVDQGSLTKDVLSMDEIKKLLSTHCPGENINTRNAFIFCLYTGLRWCDVKELRYGNVDVSNKMLRFEQAKTRGHSSASGVMIPLSDGILALIGTGDRGERIFELPSHNMCLKALRHWVRAAGIDKHITWHCARHSFAVNILNNGANIKTVSSLLGHSSLKHTEKYTRAVDSLKEAAINSLPPLELG